MSKIRVALALAAVLMLAGCFSGDPEFSEAEQVPASERAALEGGDTADDDSAASDAPVATFVAVDIAWEDAPTEVPAGTVQIELVNNGNAVHNVVIDDLGSDAVVEVNGGETAVAPVTLEPGEYRYHCSIPGHEQLMNGTLTVTG